jgi:hypothetical protein
MTSMSPDHNSSNYIELGGGHSSGHSPLGDGGGGASEGGVILWRDGPHTIFGKFSLSNSF